ncbi:hypothetical protein F5Y00DRAFT_246753 [Daldinia vernicosa]|uniref:uncharacterized protein n=1 Tax=Daldinia vernicosa TaxID=114800 RepID=UPI002007FE77|nr:uncharacterized protein F5Y00DRAFT_246753 [Daldinia vernicosa]KAI0845248.1 hypothetical protein F5Y00DRAFT_246753 [Daldinia vernicosa]
MRSSSITEAFPPIDYYDREKILPRPLVLDRVMEGRPLVSRSRLLQLPSDILTDIVNLLIGDKSTLASLAKVNSDCRQLARSSQFGKIKFNYANSRARQLLSKLGQEHISRRDNNKQGPTIGACVRWILTASQPDFVICFMRDESFQTTNRETSAQREEQAHQQYKLLRADVQRVICSALPNLEVIVWHDTYPMEISFFKHIMESPARHLWLRRLPIERQTIVTFLEERPIPPTWPLRSLVISLYLELLPREPAREETHFELAPARFFDLLLRSCAPTLESLTWLLRNKSINGKLIPQHSNDELISFPHLRLLRIGDLGPPRSILPSLFSAPLRHLSIDPQPDFELRDILADCGTFSDLETLVVQPLPESREDAEFIAGFIARHDTVKKLQVSEYVQARDETAHLDACIIPLFYTGRFEHLRTLSLAWGGGDYSKREQYTISVSVASLTAIACLASLEELSLGAAIEAGPRCHWLVDHDQLRDIFFKLKKLKGLALYHERYPWEVLSNFENHQRYYVDQSFTDDEISDVLARLDLEEDPAELTRIVDEGGDDIDRALTMWEVLHRNRMLKLTEAWAAAFPSLKWTYFGQWFMGVKEELGLGDPGRKKAVPLTERRSEHCQFLVDTFTIAGFEG